MRLAITTNASSRHSCDHLHELAAIIRTGRQAKLFAPTFSPILGPQNCYNGIIVASEGSTKNTVAHGHPKTDGCMSTRNHECMTYVLKVTIKINGLNNSYRHFAKGVPSTDYKVQRYKQ